MKPNKNTKLWVKKTYDPYYTWMANGFVKFDDRITKDDFHVKVGDWVIFQLWDEATRTYLKKLFVKAINFVRNTADVAFWESEHKNFPGITIMQFEDPECPTCGHRVQAFYAEDGTLEMGYVDDSYFQCVLPDDCECECFEEINLTYENK